VYRLKEGETIKILRKGEGAEVLSGKSALKGEWFEVMTDDGSTGWCFSYNLALYDERDTAGLAQNGADSGPDTALDSLLSRPWYPDIYRTMIEENRVDLDRISPRWGFFPGSDSRIARVETADGVQTFAYTGIEKADGGTYRFTGSSLSVQVRRADSILVQFTDASGMPQALYFCALDSTPESLIAAEQARRESILASIRQAGPRFSSGNYGVLQFLDGGKFLWSGYQLLSPGIIPSGAGGGGTVAVRCFLPADLAPEYQGILSFRFDSSNRWIHFLYSLTPDGLRMEQVSESFITDAVVQTRNLTPTVVFFTPGGN
jgi:hypothetical protein